ncbi:MAG: twin-arginine translocase TatA/TatE family subunit [Planctomycetes bacterium]|nr:twin-arginine translocase TatA/TatE family subunit [Planctomycetota bacterium]
MSTLLLIGPLGPFEILIILFVGLLIFGARLPEVGRSLGKGLMEFKRGMSGVRDQLDDIDREADRQVDEELERRALPTNPAEENASHEDGFAPYDPSLGDDDSSEGDFADEHDTGEVYADDPSAEPGPEFGGDPQPDADPRPASSADGGNDGTIVYADPDYLDENDDPDPA